MPTLARSTIQSTIASTLDAITGVENVYQDFPRANDVEEFLTKFRELDETNIQFWIIRRTASPTQTFNVPTRSVFFLHTFEIELWFGIKTDESEPLFQALIDSVLEVFSEKRTLGGCYVPVPLILTRTRNDIKNQVQCRVATFEITVQDQLNNLNPT